MFTYFSFSHNTTAAIKKPSLSGSETSKPCCTLQARGNSFQLIADMLSFAVSNKVDTYDKRCTDKEKKKTCSPLHLIYWASTIVFLVCSVGSTFSLRVLYLLCLPCISCTCSLTGSCIAECSLSCHLYLHHMDLCTILNSENSCSTPMPLTTSYHLYITY